MSSLPESQTSLAGMLLVATPGLFHDSFRRTILYLAEHSLQEGALAYILNRPIEKTITIHCAAGQTEVPVFQGGPVQPESLILASLQWRAPANITAFREFRDEQVEEEWLPGLRAFLGYAGWSPGQLESELRRKAWLVIPPTAELISTQVAADSWLGIMRQAGPIMRLMAEAPDDPSLN